MKTARRKPLPNEELAGSSGCINNAGEERYAPAMHGENKPELVALRERRDLTIQQLTDGFARDVLGIEEFEKRIDLAHQAATLEALDHLVADLDRHAPQTTQALAPRTDPTLATRRPQTRLALAFMGGFERRGSWLVPQTVFSLAFMGGGTLDFREVHLPPGVTDVWVFAVMGGIQILVPPDLAVECDGLGIMGGFESVERTPPVPDPERPVLRIRGMAVMGGVDIRTRLPGESARDARRRQRQERRLGAAERGKLPPAQP